MRYKNNIALPPNTLHSPHDVTSDHGGVAPLKYSSLGVWHPVHSVENNPHEITLGCPLSKVRYDSNLINTHLRGNPSKVWNDLLSAWSKSSVAGNKLSEEPGELRKLHLSIKQLRYEAKTNMSMGHHQRQLLHTAGASIIIFIQLRIVERFLRLCEFSYHKICALAIIIATRHGSHPSSLSHWCLSCLTSILTLESIRTLPPLCHAESNHRSCVWSNAPLTPLYCVHVTVFRKIENFLLDSSPMLRDVWYKKILIPGFKASLLAQSCLKYGIIMYSLRQ